METFQVIKEDAEPIWCEIHYTPITNDDGVTVSLEWILRDISAKTTLWCRNKYGNLMWNTKRE